MKPTTDRTNWIDSGCRLSPSCLRCSLPACAEDVDARNEAIRSLTAAGLKSADELAAMYGLAPEAVRYIVTGKRQRSPVLAEAVPGH